MAFETGRAKTGGRTKGTRNKVNMFDNDTIEQAKAVITDLVKSGDVEASKLVLSYSLSKPSSHQVGIAAELEQLKSESEITRINQKNKDAELFNI
jgi:hypothetical protein